MAYVFRESVVEIREQNGGEREGREGLWPFISERDVRHGGKVGLGMWGLGGCSDWVRGTVEG
jgi:hypothetical protein